MSLRAIIPISAALLETGQGPSSPLTDLIKSEGPDTNPSHTPAKPNNFPRELICITLSNF